MIMVNTLGYGTPDGPRGAMGPTMIPTFAKALVEEVLPQVEKSYHVAKDRNSRAIAGLSMGGAESLYTGLNNIDKFAYIGSFSGAFVMWPRANPQPPPAAPAAAGGGRGPRTHGDGGFREELPESDGEIGVAAQTALDGVRDGGRTARRQSPVRGLAEVEGHPVYEPGDPELRARLAAYGGRIWRKSLNYCSKRGKNR